MSGKHGLPKDDAFHILQNPRRRAAVRHLLEHPERDQFRMREMAEQVAAWEHDTTVEDLNSTQRQRVYIALYQSHLPKLDDYDVIEYDRNRGLIEPTPLLGVFAPYVGDGLHDANDHLTIPIEASETEQSGLTKAVAGLLSK